MSSFSLSSLSCLLLVVFVQAAAFFSNTAEAKVNEPKKEKTKIYVVAPRPGDNDRNVYQRELLRLAMHKTEPEFGPFEMVLALKRPRSRRAQIMLAENSIPNYVRPFVFNSEFANNPKLAYIKFPIYLGLLSYRVCFSTKSHLEALANAQNKEDLLSLRHIMRTGWLDAGILKYNGFTVLESEKYSSIFKMVAMGRGELFCRGLNEVQQEYEATRMIPELMLDKSLAFYYPLPMYYFSSREDKALLKRIEKGLFKAYDDGSLMQLWQKHYSESIAFARMAKRKIIYLDNPGLKGMEDSYSQYFYRPEIWPQ